MSMNSINSMFNSYSNRQVAFGAKTKVAEKFQATAPTQKVELQQEVERINSDITRLSQEGYSAWKTMAMSSRVSGQNNDAEYKQAQAVRANCRSEANQLLQRRNYYKELINYHEHLEQNPNTAFLYDPNITSDEKREKLAESTVIRSTEVLAAELGLTREVVDTLQRYGFLDADKFEARYYFDTTLPKNEELLKEITDKADSISALYMFARKYNFSLETAKKMLESGELVNIGGSVCNSDYALIDSSNPTNVESINKHLKTTPLFTKKYSKSSFGDCIHPNVAAGYLVKLGFGTPQMILEAVQDGRLDGQIVKKNTPNGVKRHLEIDLSNPTAKIQLLELRDKNPNVMEKSELARSLKMKVRDLEQAMIDDKLVIIPEYIFAQDDKKSFIDLTNPVNKEFIEQKKLDIELTEALKEARKEEHKSDMSLKTQIAWYLSPQTRIVASEHAKGDGYLARIFEKYDNDEELEIPEEITLMSYYRSVWQEAGTEEFSSAMKKANEILEQYKSQGIESIEDLGIRSILESNFAS